MTQSGRSAPDWGRYKAVVMQEGTPDIEFRGFYDRVSVQVSHVLYGDLVLYVDVPFQTAKEMKFRTNKTDSALRYFGAPSVVGGNYNVLATDVYKQVVGQQNFNMGAVV